MTKSMRVRTAALLLLVSGMFTAWNGAASAAADQSDVGPAVAWPFDTCDNRDYRETLWPGVWIDYRYNHTDFGRINYYRVFFSNGKPVGNGWASCSK